MVFSFFVAGIIAISSIYQSESAYTSDNVNSQASIGLLHSVLQKEDIISNYADITIFTHGLGGSAYDWLCSPSKDDFSRLNLEKNGKEDDGELIFENHDYLPFKLCKNIYVFGKSLNVTQVSLDDSNCFSFVENENCFDINLKEHLVVLCNEEDTSNRYTPNDDKYNNFEKTIDSLVYHYYQATSILPKINLIGHSLGGIINLMYATYHPSLISNMIGIGTPYLGSRWALAESAYNKISNPDYINNTKDICDSSIYLGNLKKWAEARSENSINAIAIGCTQSYEFLAESMDRAIAECSPILSELYSLFSPLKDLLNISRVKEAFDLFTTEFLSTTVQVLKDIVKATELAARVLSIFAESNSYSGRLADALGAFLQVLASDFVDDTVNGAVLADCCVEIESQLGKDGLADYGFEIVPLHFEKGAYNYERAEFNEPGFLHNFETKAPMITKLVSSVLKNDGKSLHCHDFALGKTSTSHFLTCECGAKTHVEGHDLPILKITDKFEYLECKCGYVRTRNHSKSYLSFREGGHEFECKACGLITSECHLLQYFDQSKTVHYAKCDCGFSLTESHSWQSGKCLKCKRQNDSQLELTQ